MRKSTSQKKSPEKKEFINQDSLPIPSYLNAWILILIFIFIGTVIYLSITNNSRNITIFLVTFFLLCSSSVFIWYVPKYYIKTLPTKPGKDFDLEKERLNLEDNTRKTFAQIVGGALILGSLLFSYNTYRLQEEGQFTDRFTNAVNQLGENNSEVCLGGMYALERIAKDSPKDHWTVIEILSAYVRNNKKKKMLSTEETNINQNTNNKVNEEEENTKVLIRTQTALTIIGRRVFEQDSKTDKINLSEVELFKADLANANLSNVKLTQSIFIKADFTKADLRNSDLTNANLDESQFVETNLSDTTLIGAKLRNAELAGADLSYADLRGTDLSGVKNLNFEQLRTSIINQSTILPNYLESERIKLLEFSEDNLKKKSINQSNK